MQEVFLLYTEETFNQFTCVRILMCCLCFYRATNIENEEANNVKNQLTGQYGAVPEVARHYKVSLICT
jgi:hypothetical protein